MRCKICDDTHYLGKAKTKFRLRFNNYKSKHQFVERENRMYHRSVFIHTLYKTATTVLMIEKSLYLTSVKRTKNLKKGKHFGNTN